MGDSPSANADPSFVATWIGHAPFRATRPQQMRTRVNLLVIARPPAVGSAVVAPPVALEMGLSAEEKRRRRALAAGPYPRPRGRAPRHADGVVKTWDKDEGAWWLESRCESSMDVVVNIGFWSRRHHRHRSRHHSRHRHYSHHRLCLGDSCRVASRQRQQQCDQRAAA